MCVYGGGREKRMDLEVLSQWEFPEWKFFIINNKNNQHLYSIYCVPGIVLSALQLLPHLIITTTISAIIILILQLKAHNS